MNDTSDHGLTDMEIMAGEEMTLEQVAQVLGVTRERVRQIQQAVLRKLKLQLERQGLTLADVNRD